MAYDKLLINAEFSMNIHDFDFSLPDNLIAKYPLPDRTASRLLCLSRDTGRVDHRQFVDLSRFLSKGDVLVFNNTRVIPARLFGKKSTGGQVEVLIERVLSQSQATAHIKASKSPKAGTKLILENEVDVEVIGRKGELFLLNFHDVRSVIDVLESVGHIPLPPYINRSDEPADWERYQTIFAKEKGAVAAPTAGLHFDDDIIKHIQSQGIQTAFITLHVGAGTFQPVRVEDISQHHMHSETIHVSQDVCDIVNHTKATGGRVVAVGTTVVRSLETAARGGKLKPFSGETDIFIYPGYEFQMIDGLVTNFHLPKSTLLMLVSALGGRENILRAYHSAIEEQYRFFSYGDGMLIY